MQISNVMVENSLFHPAAGEEAQISFYLSQDAEVAVTIFDADDSPVRTLGQDKPWFKGVNTVTWNGRDAQGRVVADDAYYFVIEAQDTSGFTARYDPAAFSGGETIHVDPFRRGEHIEYNLPKDSRVRIRIGIHNGPLLRTLIDWMPRKAGQHLEPWDGKDDSGLIVVKDLPYSIFIQAFTLPENSLITTGSGKDLIAYTLISDEESEDNLYSDASKRLILKSAKRRTEAQNPDHHPHYAMSRIIDRAPRFHLSVDNPGGMMNMGHNPRTENIPSVAGEVSLILTLDELTEQILADQRYEIIVYVDYQFLFEDEQGSHPYTFPLDTRTLTNGQHVITCNVLTLTDQIGSSSILITVQNE